MLIIFEGLVCCLIALISCVTGIADGAVNMVFFYDDKVQERCIENGLIDRKTIKRNNNIFTYCGIVPYFIFIVLSVYFVNGARGFLEGFYQMSAILLIEGIFDRLYIDSYWVNHTKTWIIPGTEDLRPYINKEAMVKKWIATLIGYPLIAAILSAIMMFVVK